MVQFNARKQQRTLGSLTSDDLGIEIDIEGTIIAPTAILHVIDEADGVGYTELYVNTSRIGEYLSNSETTFRPAT